MIFFIIGLCSGFENGNLRGDSRFVFFDVSRAVSLFADGLHAGQRAEFDVLEQGAAAGRDVGYLIGQAELVDAATDRRRPMSE